MNQSTLNTWGASADAIQSHYDVGNDFYALWLDESLTYSCALWRGDEDLHAAQLNKLDWHLSNARARDAARLLDVGCGWGALMKRAVEQYGVRHVVGLSLSEAQTAVIRQTAPEGVEVKVQSWAQYQPDKPFDAIVSIGAFEHFARLEQSLEEKLAGYREFFRFCRDALRSGGRVSLQTITYEDSSRADFSDFFAQRVFPESDLPHLTEILQAAKGLFEVEMLRNDREHYARTARCWLAGLRARRAEAIAMVGQDTVKHYEKYLSLLTLGFHTRRMNLARLVLRRIDDVRAARS